MTKPIVMTLISLLFTGNALAQSGLDLTYRPKEVLTKAEKGCLEVGFGCTQEEMLELLERKGKALNPSELESILKRDPSKKVYIPLSITDQELLTVATTTSLGIVVFDSDEEDDISDVIQRNKGEITDVVSNIKNFFGPAKTTGMVAAGSYFIGMSFKDNRLKQAGLFMVGAGLASNIVSASVKEALQKGRIVENKKPYQLFRSEGVSSEAFSIATVISELYKEDYPIVPYVAYGVAAMASYAKMHGESHWAADVMIGGILGHLVTKMAISTFSKNDENPSGVSIYPSIDLDNGAFSIMFEWKEKVPAAGLKCQRIVDGAASSNACVREVFEKMGKK